MGFLYPYGASRRDIIKMLLTEQVDHTILKHCLRGNIIWTVEEYNCERGRVRFVGCYLMQRYKDEWGYKEMDWNSGPCYFHCPLSYIKLAMEVTEPGEYALSWIEGVKHYWLNRKAKKLLKNFDKWSIVVNAIGV